MARRQTVWVGLSIVGSLLNACGSQSDWQPNDPQTGSGVGTNGANTPVYSGVVPDQHAVPISGGTLTVLHDGHTAVAADPDRDRVWIANLATQSLSHEVVLRPGDEPGRVVEGGNGRVHVVLRGGGGIVTIDSSTGAILRMRATCAAPRGLAFDPTRGVLFVACAGGELVTVDETTAAITQSMMLDADLRDAVIDGSALRVSRFRSAELLTVHADGTVTRAIPLATDDMAFGSRNDPAVAYRSIATPQGVWMVHQTARSSSEMVPIGVAHGGPPEGPRGGGGGGRGGGGAYTGGGCSEGIVSTKATRFEGGAATTSVSVPSAVLPVDVAVSRNGSRIVLVAAGNAGIRAMPQLIEVQSNAPPFLCVPFGDSTQPSEQPNGQVTAATFDGNDQLVAQTRQPAAIYLVDQHAVIHLPGTSRFDSGHELFHTNSGGGIACASCHPEGGDDGHVWNFSDVGLRRTQHLRGGVGDGPYHWGGEITDFDAIMTTIFRDRMGGPATTTADTQAVANFVRTIPIAGQPAAMTTAAERGRALFNSTEVACSSCHHEGNHALVDVGTSGGVPLKVPSLARIATRPPYLHNGCAPTLRDRITNTSCGGGEMHGHTAQLSLSQIDDLVAYLQTL